MVAAAVSTVSGRESGCALAFFPLADTTHCFREISVVDRLLGVPADVTVHCRVRPVALDRRRIPLHVERQHCEQRSRNRYRTEANGVAIDPPLVATLLNRPVRRVPALRGSGDRVVIRLDGVGNKAVDRLLDRFRRADNYAGWFPN